MALRQLATTAFRTWGLCPAAGASPAIGASLSRAFATVLPELRYATSHEYAKPAGDVVVIGVSDHAQAELGDVVYVELPEVGATFAKGDTFGVVESVKAASDVYAPVSGEVVEVNQALVDEPAKVNSSPYDQGWMIKIKMSAPDELSSLLDAAAYEKHCE